VTIELQERSLRWEPAPGIPETPIAEVALESAQSGHLRLKLKYFLIQSNDDRDLLLTFSEVRAFKVYWDGDAVSQEKDRPRCSGPRFPDDFWPLLLVENSKWIASGDFLGFGPFALDATYQHFRVLTLDRHVDIIATGAVSAEWISARLVE
jgi:hypothetical protein